MKKRHKEQIVAGLDIDTNDTLTSVVNSLSSTLVQNKTFVLTISGTKLSVYGYTDFPENQYELRAFAPFSITILGFEGGPIVLPFDHSFLETVASFKYRIGTGYFVLMQQG